MDAHAHKMTSNGTTNWIIGVRKFILNPQEATGENLKSQDVTGEELESEDVTGENLESQDLTGHKLESLLGKSKAIPLQAWNGPEGSRKLRFPDFMRTAQEGCKVVSRTNRPH